MFKVVVYWRWSLTRRGRYERVNCKHVKGVLFVKRKYTKGVPFLSEKKDIKGLGVGPRGGASPNETLMSSRLEGSHEAVQREMGISIMCRCY